MPLLQALPAPSTYWVCYDIADPKRLARVARVVAAVGEMLHESTILCELEPAALTALQKRVSKLIDIELDQVRYIPLCARDHAATRHFGTSRYPQPAAAWIV